jgi:murein DD-endopeptidase MepM/ murein hydrolase activator NlpD
MLKFVFVLLAASAISACAPFQSFVENPPAADASHSRRNYYVVQPKDNLYTIAFTLEVSPGQLRRANPWINPVYIEPGIRLLIPQIQTDYNYADNSKNYDDSEFRQSNQIDYQLQSANFVWPLNRIDISSHYGRRRGRLHAGIDLRAPRGTPIYASAAGRVKFSGYNRGYGHIIVIDHGGGIETAYAHNNRNMVRKGQSVKQGDVVAIVGRSGNATGYHVHFEFRRHGQAVNPVQFVQAAL